MKKLYEYIGRVIKFDVKKNYTYINECMPISFTKLTSPGHKIDYYVFENGQVRFAKAVVLKNCNYVLLKED